MIVSVPPTLPQFEGLKASALALALIVVPGLPQMREKKFGMLARESCTVTTGFIPNEVLFSDVQSEVPAPLEALPAE